MGHCKDFLSGMCTRGAACQFRHDPAVVRPALAAKGWLAPAAPQAGAAVPAPVAIDWAAATAAAAAAAAAKVAQKAASEKAAADKAEEEAAAAAQRAAFERLKAESQG